MTQHNFNRNPNNHPINNNLAKKRKRHFGLLGNHFVFLINFLFAGLLCFGVSGGLPRLHDVLLIWVIINCIWLCKPIFKIALLPLVALILFYPIGFEYGYPSAGMIGSLLQTNIHEAQEFITLSIVFNYCLIIVAFVLTVALSQKVIATKKQRLFFIYFSIVLSILFGVEINRKALYYSKILDIIPHSIQEYHQYQIAQNHLRTLQNTPDDWQVVDYTPHYQNYVLIIGESVLKNYVSAYGYPIPNSPFLTNVNGTQYNHYIAPAGHTITSVPRFLTIPHKDSVQSQNSIIALANKMGIKSYWLSNQERFGVFDSEISYISFKADYQHFLAEQKDQKNNHFDYELLPIFKKALTNTLHNANIDKKSPNAPKLIVVHLMGSHSDFCRRVDKKYAHFVSDGFSFNRRKNKQLCYHSSLLQTDQLLQNIYQTLNKSGQSFSMVYIPDHGLHPTKLVHMASQDSLSVPLFKISSDDMTHIIDNRPVTGMGFVWFLSEWLGIKNNNQTHNDFVKDYYADNKNDIWVFDDTNKHYKDLPSFDNTVLTPTHYHLKNTENSIANKNDD